MTDVQSPATESDINENPDISSGKPIVLYDNISSDADKVFYESLVEIIQKIIDGEAVEAVEATQILFENKPKAPELYFALGLASWSLQDFGKAIELFSVSHEIDPECRDYVDALASINTQSGQLSEGLYFAKLATVLDPHPVVEPLLPPLLSNYFSALKSTAKSGHYINGLIHYNERRFEAAAIECEAELGVNADYFDCHLLYAQCLNELGRYDEAIAASKNAATIDKHSAEPLIEAGKSLYHLGLHHDAVNTHLSALELDASIETCAAAMDGTQFLGSNFIAEKNKIQQAMNTCFDEIETFPLEDPRGKKANSEIIHVGFIINSIFNGSYYPFFEPILRHRDKSKFKLVVYKTSIAEDPLFTQIQNNVDLVRPVFDIDPETLSVIITNDRIDVLIDLSGYSEGSQYTILKQGIAPVQIGHLRYPYGINAPGKNFIISDRITAQKDKKQQSNDTEVIIADSCLYALEPFTTFPDPTPLPASTNGFITFGGYCDLATLTPEVATSMIEILQAVPTSRLLLGGVPNICDLAKEIITGMFSDVSVSQRVDFFDPESTHHATDVNFYNSIDIFLDSAPLSATNIIIEALWMGVPAIVTSGSERQSLIGASVLTAAGKPNWIANSTQEFVKLATDVSNDVATLSDIRMNLRSDLEKADLFNAKASTKSWEAALVTCLDKAKA